MSVQEPLKCPHCPVYFWQVGAFRNHIRSHPKQRSLPPPSPPTKLLSRRSPDETDGVFDFPSILEDSNDVTFDVQEDAESDGDSYFSDTGYKHDDTSTSGGDDDDNSDIRDDDDDDHDDNYNNVDDGNDSSDDSDNSDKSSMDADNSNKKRDRNECDLDEYPPDYFIGRIVDDDDIPFSENIFPPR
jgi:hypothetical protein